MLEEFRAEILSIAVWGSLTASFLLATYLLVQSLVDSKRRAPYLLFSLICITNALNDYFYADIGHQSYETARLIIWSLYPLPLLWVLGLPKLAIFGAPCLLGFIGAAVWNLWNPLYATSFVIPGAFLTSFAAHLLFFYRNQGFSSAILASTSLLLAGMCSLYLQVVATGQNSIISFGYLHYSLVCLLAVFFGWIQFPRELRGGLPVRVPRTHFFFFLVTTVSSEIAIQYSLLSAAPAFNQVLYAGSSLALVASCLIFFFNHRHLLVIYTDNIAQLLDERTTSLKNAQIELAQANSDLALQIEKQTQELSAHQQTIERQRRLEIVAQIAGQTAHDFQNLLSPITYHSQKLRHLIADSSGLAAHSLTVIDRQVQELLELNAQFLTLSRRGRLDLNPVDIGELIEEAKKRFPKVHFSVSTQGLWVLGLWSQLTRALYNLVSNAIDASPLLDGQISVSASHCNPTEEVPCTVGVLKRQNYVLLEVSDNGTGIPDDLQHRIFEPFFSSKNGQTGSGSGLGLTIVRSVVEDYQGVIDIESSPQGTIFRLYFPAVTKPSNVVDFTKLCGNETIAVIDDDTSLLNEYELFLEAAGYNVRTAATKKEAIELFRREQIDLILVDINLGRDRGIDVLFAAIHLRPGILSIIHTSFSDPIAEREFYSLGAGETIIKPAAPSQVLRSIRNHLNQPPIAQIVNN